MLVAIFRDSITIEDWRACGYLQRLGIGQAQRIYRSSLETHKSHKATLEISQPDEAEIDMRLRENEAKITE